MRYLLLHTPVHVVVRELDLGVVRLREDRLDGLQPVLGVPDVAHRLQRVRTRRRRVRPVVAGLERHVIGHVHVAVVVRVGRLASARRGRMVWAVETLREPYCIAVVHIPVVVEIARHEPRAEQVPIGVAAQELGWVRRVHDLLVLVQGICGLVGRRRRGRGGAVRVRLAVADRVVGVRPPLRPDLGPGAVRVRALMPVRRNQFAAIVVRPLVQQPGVRRLRRERAAGVDDRDPPAEFVVGIGIHRDRRQVLAGLVLHARQQVAAVRRRRVAGVRSCDGCRRGVVGILV